MILQNARASQRLQDENAPFAKTSASSRFRPARRAGSGFLGGWPLVLWDASENKDAAAKWIMFATHGDVLKDLAVASGFIPGSISLAQGARGEPPLPLFVEQLQEARPYQYPSEPLAQMGQLEVDTIQKAVQAVALGQAATRTRRRAQLCATINDVLRAIARCWRSAGQGVASGFRHRTAATVPVPVLRSSDFLPYDGRAGGRVAFAIAVVPLVYETLAVVPGLVHAAPADAGLGRPHQLCPLFTMPRLGAFLRTWIWTIGTVLVEIAIARAARRSSSTARRPWLAPRRR